MNLEFILACSDLGVHIEGAKKGPQIIYNNIPKKLNLSSVLVNNTDNIVKELEKCNKEKNLIPINEFNLNLFNSVTNTLKNNMFPFILGGDHSITIGSALASLNHYKNLGLIWIDSHGDFHNFDTTPSGNIHGLPFAAITGFENTEKLTKHISATFFNPKNSVLLGARDMQDEEIINLQKAGVTVFSTEDLKQHGINNIMKKAIQIASNNTNGIHISYDVDIIDPDIAIGVSTPAIDGITEIEALEIIQSLKENKDIIKSFDLVEYNPEKDKNNSTLNIVTNLVHEFIKGQEI